MILLATGKKTSIFQGKKTCSNIEYTLQILTYIYSLNLQRLQP